jgi:tetratricopeptide (TPR) repeat protein
VSVALDNVGTTLVRLGRARQALPYLQEARRLVEKTHGADAPELADPLTALGDAELALHAPEKALSLLEAALARRAAAKEHPPGDAGATKLALATALHALGQDERARGLADEAVRELDAGGPEMRNDAARARRLRATLR